MIDRWDVLMMVIVVVSLAAAGVLRIMVAVEISKQLRRPELKNFLL